MTKCTIKICSSCSLIQEETIHYNFAFYLLLDYDTNLNCFTKKCIFLEKKMCCRSLTSLIVSTRHAHCSHLHIVGGTANWRMFDFVQKHDSEIQAFKDSQLLWSQKIIVINVSNCSNFLTVMKVEFSLSYHAKLCSRIWCAVKSMQKRSPGHSFWTLYIYVVYKNTTDEQNVHKTNAHVANENIH